MAGAKDSQEAEIVLSLVRAARDAVDGVACERLRCECGLAGESHALCGGLVADPVADPIRVAGPLGLVMGVISLWFGIGVVVIRGGL